MFNATCLIKTDIDTVNKCMGQNPYNPETFLQNFASRLTSFDDPLLNIYPTSEIAGNIEDEDVILGLREPQKLIEWAKTMKERAQCMAMAEFSAALQKHKVEEFLGYPVNMSEAECVLEEYLNNLSDEDLANAFFETL